MSMGMGIWSGASMPFGAWLLFLAVVVAGVWVMQLIIKRKWGYTPDREKELEERTESAVQDGKRNTEKKAGRHY